MPQNSILHCPKLLINASVNILKDPQVLLSFYKDEVLNISSYWNRLNRGTGLMQLYKNRFWLKG